MRRLFFIILSFSIIMAGASFKTFAVSQESKEYYSKRNNENMIALTFDDGPHPKQTYKILDILDKYGIKATFFVVGVNAQNYPDALKAIADRGHEIGNHTFTHEYVKGKDEKSVAKDIKRCEDVVFSICGATPTLFRAPGGLMDKDTLVSKSDAFEGYDIIYWSIDTMDWAHRSPDEISKRVLGAVKSGDIILMHDYIGYNTPTANALEIMIPKLLDNGFKFVTVSELINS